MLSFLWLVPTLPLLGFVTLVATRGQMPKSWTTLVGTGSVGLAALITALIAFEFLNSDAQHFQQTLWVWMEAGNFKPGFSLYLDGLSLSMLFVITGVGFLIHVYAAGYMYNDDDFPRFFTYTNLFVAAMVMLVLADNFVLLFLGWEGVGLCSFLLIGFWYKDPENGYCARKAFIVTRVGDTAFAIGLFLLYKHANTLNIQEALASSPQLYATGINFLGFDNVGLLIAILLLGGAVGKSAQLPLQTWLPDAMAGPTPVSALIHAATMVTAGVYLIARSHALFELSATAMTLVAMVGLFTLLMSGFTALTQTDLKRVLAYSTISQIGYMFLALGLGAWTSAIFHLMTHAFFKALLFLTAGTIIMSLHHEQNIFKMGGLRKSLPVPFWLFLFGCLGLVAFPGTSGFWSKEEIIKAAWASESGGLLIWCGAVLGAFMTALYTTRMFCLVFFGEQKTQAHEPHGLKFRAPLMVLGLLALTGGFIHLPLGTSLPGPDAGHPPLLTEVAAIGLPLLGILIGWLIYGKKLWSPAAFVNSSVGKPLFQFFNSGWGMDWLYDHLLVLPYKTLARVNRSDAVDWLSKGAIVVARASHKLLTLTQNGQLRYYVATMATASVLVIALAVWW
jgi:NADH-quinone oxidoreductase subunit L